MQLSLTDAATRLGLSLRQLRYQIKTGRLTATKVGGRWVIDEALLPADPAREQRQQARAAELRATVDEALRPQVRATRPYTVRDIRAFNEAVETCRAARAALGDHPAVGRLEDCALSLSRGAHAWHGRIKTDAWLRAREAAADAVAMLYLHEGSPAEALAERVEAQVLPALSGLLRRQERLPTL